MHVNIHLGLNKCKSIYLHLHTYVSEYFLSCERKVNLLMCISALLGCCNDTGCSICVIVLQFLLHPSATCLIRST